VTDRFSILMINATPATHQDAHPPLQRTVVQQTTLQATSMPCWDVQRRTQFTDSLCRENTVHHQSTTEHEISCNINLSVEGEVT
jgi:hypothetical protein